LATFWFLRKSSIFDETFHYSRNFLILAKISIFDEKFYFWRKVWLLTNISMFDKKFDCWRKFRFFDEKFDFWRKFRFFWQKVWFWKFWILWKFLIILNYLHILTFKKMMNFQIFRRKYSSKILLLTKISIFAKDFDFWRKFLFLAKLSNFGEKLKKIKIFDENCIYGVTRIYAS